MVDKGRGSDKLYFRYKGIPQWDITGEQKLVRKPMLEVTLRKISERKDPKTNRELRVLGLIDSGADMSYIPLDTAETLHLDIDASPNRILTIAGITSVFQTTAHVEIPRKGKFPVIVGRINAYVMPPNSEHSTPDYLILGRKDFFEKFQVCINESKQTILLKDTHKGEIKQKKFKKR